MRPSKAMLVSRARGSTEQQRTRRFAILPSSNPPDCHVVTKQECFISLSIWAVRRPMVRPPDPWNNRDIAERNIHPRAS